MNRAQHLYELLKESGPQCGKELWPQLDTGAFRAFREAKLAGLPVDNLRDENGKRMFHDHDGKRWAVYHATDSLRSPVFQELQKLKALRDEVTPKGISVEQHPTLFAYDRKPSMQL